MDARALPKEWLRRMAEKHLSAEEKKLIESLGGFDKLMETLKGSGLRNRRGPPPGAVRNGSAPPARPPFGAYGYNPEGVRSAQDESRHRRAVKVWDKREFRNLDDTVELGTRNIKVALRRLRRWVREGRGPRRFSTWPERSSPRPSNGWLDVKTRPEGRRNAVKLLMFF